MIMYRLYGGVISRMMVHYFNGDIKKRNLQHVLVVSFYVNYTGKIFFWEFSLKTTKIKSKNLKKNGNKRKRFES